MYSKGKDVELIYLDFYKTFQKSLYCPCWQDGKTSMYGRAREDYNWLKNHIRITLGYRLVIIGRQISSGL